MTALARHIPSVPPYFADDFIRGGWREVERLYGARTDLLLKWIELCGGDELYERRKEAMRLNGVGAHARAGGNRPRPRGVDVEGWLG